ncbi:MAG: Holliday junction resolvase RuvX [Sporichthyaceae bacterium]|nr:Holliday junction resolvase RuvX [Sporichthyaceae bacterium]
MIRPGARIGVDVGSVRIGVAACDPDGLLATPVETVPRGRGDVERIVALAEAHSAIEIVVGLPRSLSGAEGPAADGVRDFARILAGVAAPIPVRLCDERLSTVSAQRGMRSSGVRGREARQRLDQAAAVVILQSALDTERATGRPPGRTVQAET